MFAPFLPEDVELQIAERLIVELRQMVAQLDLAIANYQDAFNALKERTP